MERIFYTLNLKHSFFHDISIIIFRWYLTMYHIWYLKCIVGKINKDIWCVETQTVMMCYKIIVLRLSETFRGLMLSNLNIDCSNSTRYGTRPFNKIKQCCNSQIYLYKKPKYVTMFSFTVASNLNFSMVYIREHLPKG